MDEEKHSADNSRHHHEQRDTNAKHLLLYGVTLVVLVVCSMAAMGWLFRFYVSHQPARQPRSPLMERPQLPPKPRLETNPHADLERKLQADKALLNTYGWVSRQDGVVRMPIDRAIDLLAKRGLPARKQNTSGQHEEIR